MSIKKISTIAVGSALVLSLSACLGNKKNNAPAEPAKNVAPQKQIVSDNAEDRTFFAYDSATLTAHGKKLVAQKAKYIKANNLKVEIAGYCDERGSEEYNYKLGLRRAEAVKKALIAKGVSAESISIVSHGEKPLVQGKGEKVWKQNRASVFTLEKYAQLSLEMSSGNVVSSISDEYSSAFIG